MNQFRRMAKEALDKNPIKEGATDIIGTPITEKAFLDYFEHFFRRNHIQSKVCEALREIGVTDMTSSYVVMKKLAKLGIELQVREPQDADHG
jgi:hypothetical protein